MQPVSAADALGLAFNRTRSVLAPGPFSLGRFFKLALLAALTQATFLSISISYPLQGGQLAVLSQARRASRQVLASGGIGSLAGAFGIGILLTVLGVALTFSIAYLYLVCRCRATLFDVVLQRGGRIRDAWRRQSRPARRYFAIFLLAMLIFWTILAAVIGPVVVRFVKLFSEHPGTDATAQMGSLMLTLVGLVWLLLPVWIVIDALLQDFILPGLVLEQQLPLGVAFARLGTLIRRSPGQLLLFLVLRAVVAFAVATALGLVVLIALGLVALCGIGIGWLLYSLLWNGGLAAHAVFFAVIAGMVLVLTTLYLLCVTAVYGVTGSFKTSYGIYFYAGYYQALAARLEGGPPDEELLVGAALPPSLPPLSPLKARADLPPELW